MWHEYAKTWGRTSNGESYPDCSVCVLRGLMLFTFRVQTSRLFYAMNEYLISKKSSSDTKTPHMTGNIDSAIANTVVDPQIYTTQFLLLLCQSIHLMLQEVEEETVNDQAMAQIIDKLNSHPLIVKNNPDINKISLKPSEALELYYNLLRQHNINQENGLQGNKEICELLYANRIKELEDKLKLHQNMFKEQVKYLQRQDTG